MPYFGGTFGMDDWVMVATMVFPVADAGLGLDIWRIPLPNITRIFLVQYLSVYAPLAIYTRVLTRDRQIYYVDEALYLSILPLTKISILCFYLRVFPTRYVRISAIVMIMLNIGYFLGFVLASLFQCRPINGAWLHWDGAHNSVCTNVNAQGWASAVVNIIFDLATMALPLREIHQLSLSRRRKIYLLAVFCLGIFGTIVSGLRLRSLLQFANTQNPTWDYVDVGYWSTIEVHVGVICACLPPTRPLLRRLLPSVFGTTQQDMSYATASQPIRSKSHSDTTSPTSPKSPRTDVTEFIPLVEIESWPRTRHAL
ncbi:hypothetical protein EYZ11_012620 [Aspergillus tanneri]|uniref:Rhodopsin domain-containing protein n=1 Tax=Aspergillus tanneri TaxID=1220188 RepID=A0A4S3J1X0_9EURO|nr:hypothetical protein EYZ11_012620 [Aspergillus tanneri]